MNMQGYRGAPEHCHAEQCTATGQRLGMVLCSGCMQSGSHGMTYQPAHALWGPSCSSARPLGLQVSWQTLERQQAAHAGCCINTGLPGTGSGTAGCCCLCSGGFTGAAPTFSAALQLGAGCRVVTRGTHRSWQQARWQRELPRRSG